MSYRDIVRPHDAGLIHCDHTNTIKYVEQIRRRRVVTHTPAVPTDRPQCLRPEQVHSIRDRHAYPTERAAWCRFSQIRRCGSERNESQHVGRADKVGAVHIVHGSHEKQTSKLARERSHTQCSDQDHLQQTSRPPVVAEAPDLDVLVVEEEPLVPSPLFASDAKRRVLDITAIHRHLEGVPVVACVGNRVGEHKHLVHG